MIHPLIANKYSCVLTVLWPFSNFGSTQWECLTSKPNIVLCWKEIIPQQITSRHYCIISLVLKQDYNVKKWKFWSWIKKPQADNKCTYITCFKQIKICKIQLLVNKGNIKLLTFVRMLYQWVIKSWYFKATHCSHRQRPLSPKSLGPTDTWSSENYFAPRFWDKITPWNSFVSLKNRTHHEEKSWNLQTSHCFVTNMKSKIKRKTWLSGMWHHAVWYNGHDVTPHKTPVFTFTSV